MAETVNSVVAVVGIDIGKNSFYAVGLVRRGAILLHRGGRVVKLKRAWPNMPPCLIAMETWVGAHRLSRRLRALDSDARLMPAKYVRPYPIHRKSGMAPLWGTLIPLPLRMNRFCKISLPALG